MSSFVCCLRKAKKPQQEAAVGSSEQELFEHLPGLTPWGVVWRFLSTTFCNPRCRDLPKMPWASPPPAHENPTHRPPVVPRRVRSPLKLMGFGLSPLTKSLKTCSVAAFRRFFTLKKGIGDPYFHLQKR